MNEKLNIQDLIELLAQKHGMDKADADSFVKEFFQLIEESLETDKYVKIRGLGTFKLIEVDRRESVNIRTGERFEIQGHTKVSFTPEPALKDIINKPFAHFETVVLNDETVLEDTPVDGGVEEDEEKEEEAPAEQKSEEPVEMPKEEIVEVVEEEITETTEEKIEPDEETRETDEEIREIEDEIIDTVTEIAIKQEVIAESEETIDESITQPDDATDDFIESVVIAEPLVQDDVFVEPEKSVQEEEVSAEDKADSTSMKFFIGIVIFVVLLCVGAVVFMYYPDLFDEIRSTPPTENTADEKAENEPVNPVALTDSVIPKDTIAIAKEDTVAEVAIQTPVVTTTEKEIEKKETKKPAASAPVEPDSLHYKIVGTKTTYTIKEGETLTKVALRFYGTKTLWPYIVKHNPDVIKNPDHVPYGTVVKIPELVKK